MTTSKPPVVENNTPNRCRLILIIEGNVLEEISAIQLSDTLAGGDVASVIFAPGSLDESTCQPLIEQLIVPVQSAGAAAIVADHTRTAGRIGADGIQLGQDPDALRDAVDKFTPKMMVGAANVKTRHTALVIGELQPDYLMFGKPGGDIRPEPHPKNLDLGGWWSSMVEIPCIVLGGSALDSVVDVANTGCEFVALSSAIFAPNEGAINIAGAADRVQRVNHLLDECAPQFGTPDA